MAAHFVRNGRIALPAIGEDNLELFISIYINKRKKCSRIYSDRNLSSFLYSFTVNDVVRTVQESVSAYHLTGSTKKAVVSKKWYKTPKCDGFVPIFAVNDRAKNWNHSPNSKKTINENNENEKALITDNDTLKEALNIKNTVSEISTAVNVKDEGHNEKLSRVRSIKSSKGSYSNFLFDLKDNFGPNFLQHKETDTLGDLFSSSFENNVKGNKSPSRRAPKKANWAEKSLQKVCANYKFLNKSFKTMKDKKDGNRAGKSAKQSEDGNNYTISSSNDKENNGEEFMVRNIYGKKVNMAVGTRVEKVFEEYINQFPNLIKKDGNCGGKCSKYKADNNEHTNKRRHCLGKYDVTKKDIDSFTLLQKRIPQKTIYSGIATKKARLTSEDIDSIDMKAKQIFTGFTTGNRKKINISETTIKKTSSILEDLDSIDMKTKQIFTGFTTGNSKKINISETTITKTSSILEDLDSIDMKTKQIFTGFTTGNSKKINISETTFKKTSSILEESGSIDMKTKQIFTGFTTGNSKKINVSETTIRKAKSIFEDMDVFDSKEKSFNKPVLSNQEHTLIDNNWNISRAPEDPEDIDAELLLDSQLTKVFEEPMYEKDSTEEIVFATPKSSTEPLIGFTFDQKYKKQKHVQLKDFKFSKSGHRDFFLFQHNYDELLTVTFDDRRNNISKNKLSIKTLINIFRSSVDDKIIPNGWLENHSKQILWKLISYEIQFGENMQFVCNARELIHQLKYRYDRELCNMERPALRKVYQRDEPSTRPMVLSVLKIISNTRSDDSSSIKLILTDGWYCIRAIIDGLLTRMIVKRKIVVGTKLMVVGAELINCQFGTEPWEEEANGVLLKIFGNSTRRVRWHTRLGFHGIKSMPLPLSSISMDGGRISSLRAFVTRVYPIHYVETLEDKSTVRRSEHQEQVYQIEKERELQLRLEEAAENVRKTFDQQSTNNRGRRGYALETGSQIANAIKDSEDAAAFWTTLTSTQKLLFSTYKDQNLEQMRKIVEQTMGGQFARNVVTLQRIRISTCSVSGHITGVLSMWGCQPYPIAEHSLITVTNVVPTIYRNNEIHMSMERLSVITENAFDDNVVRMMKPAERVCRSIRNLVCYSHKRPYYDEIDTVGLVFLVEPFMSGIKKDTMLYHNVYLADDCKNLICIKILGGLKRAGLENIVVEGAILAALNLKREANYVKNNILYFLFTEYSELSKCPRNANARGYINELNNKFRGINIKEYCNICTLLKARTSLKRSYSEIDMPLLSGLNP